LFIVIFWPSTDSQFRLLAVQTAVTRERERERERLVNEEENPCTRYLAELQDVSFTRR